MEIDDEIEVPDQCRMCLGDHDEDMHAATLGIRAWLRSEVDRKLRYVAELELEQASQVA